MAAAAAYNYSTLLSAAAAADPSLVLASTETLLCNIQGLLKLAADNARDNDHKSTYEKGKKHYMRFKLFIIYFKLIVYDCLLFYFWNPDLPRVCPLPAVLY